MAEARVRRGRRRSARERVADLLARDFPGLDLDVGERPTEIETAGFRAVALPAKELPAEIGPALDHFTFPADTPASGIALLFRTGDGTLRALRRFYLPPVVFAGAGPGGAALMTLAATAALARADVVLADCLCGEEVLRFVRPGAE
ncbi:MAG: SAM-dependent methyltransferase, partial [Planctomycetota bacterium]